MQTQPKKLDIPVSPGQWSLFQIQEALKRQLPPTMLKKLPADKGNAQYLPWYTVNKVLDKYAPGWTWEIKETLISRDRIFIVGRLTIPTSEGNVYREASGTEELKRLAYDKKLERYTEKEIAYGDPSSNAESMAFRRCAARFGLGLYLYER
ncbi:MAG: Rad52/Rad22 family DNA repair protein [Waterburya sp.]